MLSTACARAEFTCRNRWRAWWRLCWDSITGLRHSPTFASASPAGLAAPSSYTPPQVAEAYKFPASASGAGQTIGIIELGGGYRQTDLTAYFKTLKLSAPSVTAVIVDGGKNQPSKASSADGEVMLDIEVAAFGGAWGEDRRVLCAQHGPGFYRRYYHCGA